jgi:hypothetical protein
MYFCHCADIVFAANEPQTASTPNMTEMAKKAVRRIDTLTNGADEATVRVGLTVGLEVGS